MASAVILVVIAMSTFIPVPKNTILQYAMLQNDLFYGPLDTMAADKDKLNWIDAAYAKYAKQELTFEQFASFLK